MYAADLELIGTVRTAKVPDVGKVAVLFCPVPPLAVGRTPVTPPLPDEAMLTAFDVIVFVVLVSPVENVRGTSYALVAVYAAVPSVPPGPTLMVAPSVPESVIEFVTACVFPVVIVSVPAYGVFPLHVSRFALHASTFVPMTSDRSVGFTVTFPERACPFTVTVFATPFAIPYPASVVGVDVSCVQAMLRSDCTSFAAVIEPASIAFVTAPAAIVVAMLVVPIPVTFPVSVIV